MFGGNLLNWVDEIAYIRVTLDLPGYKFVTIGLDQIEFKYQVARGQILCFECEQTRLGNTSVTYRVSVTGQRYEASQDKTLFETNITFVAVNGKGQKTVIEA